MPAMGKEYALDSAGVGTIAKDIESSLKARGMNRGLAYIPTAPRA